SGAAGGTTAAASTGGTSGTAGTSGTGSSGGTGGTSGSPDAGIYGIPGLVTDTTVTYDANDIPHIHCQAFADCLRIQGYLHAQDRLFEMDLDRHVAEGRLSELVGAPGLTQDQFFRTLFMTRDGRPLWDALVSALDPETASLLQGY